MEVWQLQYCQKYEKMTNFYFYNAYIMVTKSLFNVS